MISSGTATSAASIAAVVEDIGDSSIAPSTDPPSRSRRSSLASTVSVSRSPVALAAASSAQDVGTGTALTSPETATASKVDAT